MGRETIFRLEENTVMSSRGESLIQKAERAYAFLAEAASKHCPFTLEEFATYSGYTVGTAKNYFSKKWYWFSKRQGDGRYEINDRFLAYSLDALKKDLSQKVPPPLDKSLSISDDSPSLGESWDRLLSFHFSAPITLMLVSSLLAWAFALHTLRKHFWWFIPI